jgi:hypothetical protein
MNKDPWFIAYRIVANKLKIGNIISVKKIDGFMIIGWQKTADEIIKSLFLEAIVGDCSRKECCRVRRNKRIRKHIKTK